MPVKGVVALLVGFSCALSAFAQTSEQEKPTKPAEPEASARSAKPAKTKAKEKTRKPERVRKQYTRPRPRGT